MDLYTIIIIIFAIIMIAIIGGVLKLVMWMDKKIDTKNRMGYSAYLKSAKEKKERIEEEKSSAS